MTVARAPASAMDGRTTHVRYTPFERRFSYPLAQVLLDINHVGEAAKAVKLFAYNRFNLLSFHDKDHGDRTGAPLRPWAEMMFARGGVELDGGRIELLCFPRVLGYVFNPISVFFGYGPDDALRGVIYEVNNTFGETHSYVAAACEESASRHQTAKRLHVSPFMGVEGGYRFAVQAPTDTFHLTIENMVAGERTHLATLVARRHAFTDGWALRSFLALPFSTLQVIAGIHWQALKLWLRGAKYHSRPAPPVEGATIAAPVAAQSSVQRGA